MNRQRFPMRSGSCWVQANRSECCRTGFWPRWIAGAEAPAHESRAPNPRPRASSLLRSRCDEDLGRCARADGDRLGAVAAQPDAVGRRVTGLDDNRLAGLEVVALDEPEK